MIPSPLKYHLSWISDIHVVKENSVKPGGVNGVRLVINAWVEKPTPLLFCLLVSLCEILNSMCTILLATMKGALSRTNTHTCTFTETHTHTHSLRHTHTSTALHSWLLNFSQQLPPFGMVPEGSLGIWIWQGIPFPRKSGLPSDSRGTA